MGLPDSSRRTLPKDLKDREVGIQVHEAKALLVQTKAWPGRWLNSKLENAIVRSSRDLSLFLDVSCSRQTSLQRLPYPRLWTLGCSSGQGKNPSCPKHVGRVSRYGCSPALASLGLSNNANTTKTMQMFWTFSRRSCEPFLGLR